MSTRTLPRKPQQIETKSRERREWVRYRCVQPGECQPVAVLETGNRWPTQAFDISAGGVGLVLSRRFEPGTLLAVSLTGPHTGSTSLPLARVCRVTPTSTHWLLGCTWAGEMDRDSLRSVVGPVAMWTALRARVRNVVESLENLLSVEGYQLQLAD